MRNIRIVSLLIFIATETLEMNLLSKPIFCCSMQQDTFWIYMHWDELASSYNKSSFALSLANWVWKPKRSYKARKLVGVIKQIASVFSVDLISYISNNLHKLDLLSPFLTLKNKHTNILIDRWLRVKKNEKNECKHLLFIVHKLATIVFIRQDFSTNFRQVKIDVGNFLFGGKLLNFSKID